LYLFIVWLNKLNQIELTKKKLIFEFEKLEINKTIKKRSNIKRYGIFELNLTKIKKLNKPKKTNLLKNQENP